MICQWCNKERQDRPGICPHCHRFPTFHAQANWLKIFVTLLKDEGISHDLAMKIGGYVAEMRQQIYLEGYHKGFSDCGFE